jgi:hypothetical protein
MFIATDNFIEAKLSDDFRCLTIFCAQFFGTPSTLSNAMNTIEKMSWRRDLPGNLWRYYSAIHEHFDLFRTFAIEKGYIKLYVF